MAIAYVVQGLADGTGKITAGMPHRLTRRYGETAV
jgi:hypothetical protein